MSLPGLDAPPPISLGPEQSLSYTGDDDPPSWLLLEQCVVLSSADMTMNVFVGVCARAVGEGGKEGGLRLISYAPDYVMGKRLPLLHEKTINHPTHVLLYMHATHRDIPPPSPPPHKASRNRNPLCVRPPGVCRTRSPKSNVVARPGLSGARCSLFERAGLADEGV